MTDIKGGRQLSRVMIMAGGTGGHVFPGLAVAHALREQGVAVRWLGTPNSFEAQKVPAANIPFDTISITGIRGKNWRTQLLAPLRILQATWQAARHLRRFRPTVVLGMGGFVSGPGGLASWLLRIPLVIHEQNAYAGTTNRLLARVARQTLQAFPNTLPHALTVGNPVRPAILAVSPMIARDATPLRLFILGGSLGAAAINALLPAAIALLPENMRPEIRHQSGEKDFSVTLGRWQAVGIKAEVSPFIEDMAAAYQWADLVLCRAGALTVAELCAAGRGAILIPYPYATDDHQAANANFMVRAGAAMMYREAGLTAEQLAALLTDFIKQPTRCQHMGEAARRVREVNTVAEIIDICEEKSR